MRRGARSPDTVRRTGGKRRCSPHPPSLRPGASREAPDGPRSRARRFLRTSNCRLSIYDERDIHFFIVVACRRVPAPLHPILTPSVGSPAPSPLLLRRDGGVA